MSTKTSDAKPNEETSKTAQQDVNSVKSTKKSTSSAPTQLVQKEEKKIESKDTSKPKSKAKPQKSTTTAQESYDDGPELYVKKSSLPQPEEKISKSDKEKSGVLKKARLTEA